MTQNVLFSVAGETPAVITETLFGLWKEKQIMGGYIHILTTSEGEKKLRPLLGTQGAVARFNRDYQTAWTIPESWHETEGGIEVLTNVRGDKLGDLQTTAQNNIAADRIAAIVQYWTNQIDVILHASLAGGRRTMGVFLAQAMSWFARPGDDLYHVVAPHKEKIPNWFYPARDDSNEQKLIHFSAQPFVRMRGLLPKVLETSQEDERRQDTENSEAQDTENSEAQDQEKSGFFTKMVAISQMLLEDAIYRNMNLELDLIKCRLTLKDSNKNAMIEIPLQPVWAAIYLLLFYYANTARKGDPPISLKLWKDDYRLKQINPCQPFNPQYCYEYREFISKCLNHAQVGAKATGLTQLCAPSQTAWPNRWQERGRKDHEESRSLDLGHLVSKLRKKFEKVLENHDFSFLVKGEFKNNIFVDIDPNRLQVIPEFKA